MRQSGASAYKFFRTRLRSEHSLRTFPYLTLLFSLNKYDGLITLLPFTEWCLSDSRWSGTFGSRWNGSFGAMVPRWLSVARHGSSGRWLSVIGKGRAGTRPRSPASVVTEQNRRGGDRTARVVGGRVIAQCSKRPVLVLYLLYARCTEVYLAVAKIEGGQVHLRQRARGPLGTVWVWPVGGGRPTWRWVGDRTTRMCTRSAL